MAYTRSLMLVLVSMLVSNTWLHFFVLSFVLACAHEALLGGLEYTLYLLLRGHLYLIPKMADTFIPKSTPATLVFFLLYTISPLAKAFTGLFSFFGHHL